MNDPDTPRTIGGAITRWFGGWDRFWFTPADPTTLGFMRICCGLLVLYTHLAYSYDLLAFFGPDAWLSHEYVTKLRREVPSPLPPGTWEPPLVLGYVPADPLVGQVVVDFIQQLPEEPVQREKILQAILQPPESPLPGVRIPDFVLKLPKEPPDQPPESLYGRRAFVEFVRGLPRNVEERDDLLRYVFTLRYDPRVRPHSPLPTDAVDRKKLVDYVVDWKVDPRDLAYKGWYTWSIWYHVTDPTWIVIIHIVFLGVMVLFTLGFCTRVTSVLTWLAALSYIQRSDITLYGADTMMNILLIYLMIGPSGDALSLDRFISRWWIDRQRTRRGLPLAPERPPAPSVPANVALRLLQIHFCIIYLAAGLSKMLGGAWWNGTAIYQTMANYEFSPLAYGSSIVFFRWLCQNFLLWQIVMTAGTWFTVALEISFAFLVWNRRLRPFLVAGSVLLHTSIALTMGLAVFSLFMATMVLAFVPGQLFESVLGLSRKALRAVRPPPEPVEAAPKSEPSSSKAIRAGR